MAPLVTRSLRAASVGEIRFDLARFERDLCAALGEPLRADPGCAGSGDPVLTDGPDRALTSYLLAEFMSKFDDGIRNPRKVATTWERFHEAERLCFETNQRLAVEGFKGPHEQTILFAQRIAARILGTFSWDAAAEGFDFGPGASTRLRRRQSDAAFKFSGSPETTVGNAILADAAIRSIPVWQQTLPDLGDAGIGYCKIVAGNRIVTVPKNYKTDRTIAIEPCMNMYVQKGIGALMRRRLKAAGCDLDDQTRNQRLAMVGSLTNRLATIDLSMASDTVSRVFVQKFIRPDWLEALEQSRSPFGVLPSGEKTFYQKFSSMGNGYTFELESLIFYSLALAHTLLSGEEVNRVSVYGDDIILPSAVAESFVGLLLDVGFRTNAKKSYWTSPFRESCGKHYYHGRDITPFYVRRPVKKLTDLFLLHNNLQRWAWRSGRGDAVAPLLHKLRYLAPAKWRKPRLPDGFGDGAFIGTFPMVEPTLQAHPQGWEYYVAEVLLEVSKPEVTDVAGMLVKSLRKLNRRGVTILPHVPDSSGRPRPVGSQTDAFPSREGRVRPVKVLIPRSTLGACQGSEFPLINT